MAKPIEFTPTPVSADADAHDELEALLQTLHEHGVLRLANDLVATNTQWLQIVADGLGAAGTSRAVQNLAVVGMVLSRIDPKDLYKLLFALRGSVESLAASGPDSRQPAAPGLVGFYRILKDEQLWRTLTPVIEAMKVFGDGLDRKVDSPIADFSAKADA